jgi:cytochrome c-type biogenesis protein CcmH
MRKLLLVALLFFCLSAFAAEDVYQFTSKAEQARFYQLTTELRCLVCQNQNLAESNAGLANDLRNEIYNKMQEGNTDQQIVDYLVARYGNFILYKPPVSSATLALWFVPLVFLLSGLLFLFFYVRKAPATEAL